MFALKKKHCKKSTAMNNKQQTLMLIYLSYYWVVTQANDDKGFKFMYWFLQKVHFKSVVHY